MKIIFRQKKLNNKNLEDEAISLLDSIRHSASGSSTCGSVTQSKLIKMEDIKLNQNEYKKN